MPDLTAMTTDDWRSCSEALSQTAVTGDGAANMEEAGQRIVSYLYDHLTDGKEGQQRACALVRLYKTHSYQNLPASLMDYVDGALGGLSAFPAMKCLTLIATAGDEPAWRDRTRSVGHQAIPLVNEEMVARIPMVARLVDQFGLDTKAVLQPDPELVLQLEQKTYAVFHVAEAENSPAIPAQDFVRRYGIRSVVGFGGMLPSGDLFAVILFSRVAISRATAEEFAGLALPVKIALLPFAFRNVFRSAAVTA